MQAAPPRTTVYYKPSAQGVARCHEAFVCTGLSANFRTSRRGALAAGKMAKVLAVLAALVLGAEAGLTANGGNCADSDAGLCRMPEVAAKVALEVETAGGNCTGPNDVTSGSMDGPDDVTCPCWELDAYKTDEAAFEVLRSYSGGCATDEVYPSNDCAEVDEDTDPTEGDEEPHGRIRDVTEQLMTQAAMDAAFAAGCLSSAYDGPVPVTPADAAVGTELADFPLASGQNWCGPWATRTDTAKTCTKSIFDANGALFLIITGATNLPPLLPLPLDADPQRARAAGGALIIIFFQCSLVGAYELLCSSKGAAFDEDAEP